MPCQVVNVNCSVVLKSRAEPVQRAAERVEGELERLSRPRCREIRAIRMRESHCLGKR